MPPQIFCSIRHFHSTFVTIYICTFFHFRRFSFLIILAYGLIFSLSISVCVCCCLMCQIFIHPFRLNEPRKKAGFCFDFFPFSKRPVMSKMFIVYVPNADNWKKQSKKERNEHDVEAINILQFHCHTASPPHPQ